MKHFNHVLLVIISLLAINNVYAASVSLDAVTGTFDDGGVTKILANQPVEFSIRLSNPDGPAASGLTNGFKVSSTIDGFTPLAGSVDPGFESLFTLGFFINYFGNDGIGADTVGFGGASLGTPILSAGDDLVPYTITTGGFTEGATVCLDSAYYPPSGSWLWAPTGAPTWDGPHCFEVIAGCLPPTITNAPVSLNGSHCDVMTYDFDSSSDDFGIVYWSSNIGSIDENGVWTYAPSLEDVGTSMTLIISASEGGCDESVEINLNFTNEAPVITCPPTTHLCTGGIFNFAVSAVDECDPISFSIGSVSGDITASIDPNTGDMEVIAGIVAGPFSIEIIASDGNESSSCTFGGDMVGGCGLDVEIPCIGDQTSNFVYQGQHVEVPILLNGFIIDGYDLLIAYDNSALSFQNASAGADLIEDHWEYFTYRYGPDGNCGTACPSGMLRIVAIAESNNGPYHPIIDGVSELAVMDFLVSNDRTLECQQVPIRFFWMDCGDNALSSDGGNSMYVSQIVWDGDPTLNPPNGQEIQDYNYGFPTYFGTQDECIIEQDGKPAPIRWVNFNNGCVQIACADSIDARGDINLNHVPNEIADAVLLSNYFVYGIGVFTVNTEGQIAATDVNADGISLSVADLVYLIRVIVGDAQPYSKLVPVNETIISSNGTYSVNNEMGAALVLLNGQADIDLLADDMEVKTEYDNNAVITRALIYSLNGNTFNGEFFQTDAEVISIELGAADGALVNAKILPGEYELEQNYPNPFNPVTTIRFSIPTSEDINLSIYNVTGQKVAEFAGGYEAGTHEVEWDASALASGIYFYKLSAGEINVTKKMILLK